jgi:hypothetical protein
MTGFPAVMARSYLAIIFADRGTFEQGIVHGQEGIRVAEALDHPYSLAAACWALAYLQITGGHFRHAVHVRERGLALSRNWDLSLSVARQMGRLGDPTRLVVGGSPGPPYTGRSGSVRSGGKSVSNELMSSASRL